MAISPTEEWGWLPAISGEIFGVPPTQAGCAIDELGERVRKYSREFTKRLHSDTTDAESLVNWLVAASRFADEYVTQVKRYSL